MNLLLHLLCPWVFYLYHSNNPKRPTKLRRNCIALLHSTFLHRNCNVTALQCRIKVEFILTWNWVMLGWLSAERNQYIGTTTQCWGTLLVSKIESCGKGKGAVLEHCGKVEGQIFYLLVQSMYYFEINGAFFSNYGFLLTLLHLVM